MTTYLEEAQRVGQIALTMWNRDPGSSSCGSFDRMYWGWKFKDFSDASLQYSVRLAVEYARGVTQTATLPVLLEEFAMYCATIQHADGSFDQCYPHEKSPGVFFDFLSALIYVRTSPLLESNEARRILDDVMERGVAFLLDNDETHGRVSNHTAQYAFELFNYAAYSGDDRARRRGEAYLERTLSWFDAAEGWFLEYHGADAGYQTRTLRYLAKIAALDRDETLWRTVAQAARFVEHMLMPDGSIHPMLGCRSTALLYPSSFEMLAARDPQFQHLVARIRSAWGRNRVPLPSQLDFPNAIRLGTDALDAARIWQGELAASADDVPGSTMVFPNAGIVVQRSAALVTYISIALGGTIVIYRRTAEGGWCLAHEDSGYLIKSNDGVARWLTRVPQAGKLVELDADHLVVEAQFYRSLHEEMTPVMMIALRLLNMTFLRLQWLGDVFRKLVVGRLMGERQPLGARLIRKISFCGGIVRIRDQVISAGTLGKGGGAGLYRCRRASGVHMASARYFQTQDLEEAAGPWVVRLSDMVESGYAVTLEIGAAEKS